MIQQGITPALNATGQVLVSSFVKMDSTTKYSVVQATGPQDLMIGVSQQGSWLTPGIPGGNTTTCTPPSTSTTPPAPSTTTPYQIAVFAAGSVVRLQLSTNCGTIVPGQILTSAQDGTGIDTTNAAIANLEHSYAGAIALTNGSAGQFIRVLVIAPFEIGTAAANILRVSLTPGTVAPFSAADQTFSIAGFNAAPNDPVLVSAEGLTTNIGIVNAIALSAGSLKIRFINPTAASIVPSAQFFDIVSF